jgi:O-antigen/teichoic acid export membrane protein
MFNKFKDKGLYTTFLVTAIIAVLGLTSGVFLAHNLTVLQRGEYATIIVWVTAFGIIGEFGLGFALSYFAGKNPSLLNQLWSIGILFSSIAGIILIVLGLIIFPLIFKFNSLLLYGLFITLFSLPFSINTGFTSFILLGLGDIGKYNFVRITTSFINTLFVLLSTNFFKGDIIFLSVFYSINQIISLILVHKIFIRRYRPIFRWNKLVFRSVFNYGIKTYFSSISAQINFRLDQLIMSSYSNISQLSIYAIAVSYSSILTPIYSTFGTIIFPKLLAINEIGLKLLITLKYTILSVLVSLPFLLILFFFSDEIIVLIFSSKYLSSVPSSRILIIAIVFEGINRILGNALRAMGLPMKPAFSEFLGLFSSLVLLYLLLPEFGAVGASLASLLTYVLIMLCQIFFLYRLYLKNRVVNSND